MPDVIATVGQSVLRTFAAAAKSIFSYGAGWTQPSNTGVLSPSNTQWLYNNTGTNLLTANAPGGIWAGGAADLPSSSLFMIALNWQINAFCDAQPIVEKWEKPDTRNAVWLPDYDHPAIALLRNPNDILTGQQMMAGALCDIAIDANSYIFKQKNGLGDVIALHWSPWYQWKIVTTPEDAAMGIPISYYERTVQSGKNKSVERYLPSEIIHLKGGKPDPADPRRAWNDSAAFLSEITTDKGRAYLTNKLLSQPTLKGIISPDSDEVEWGPDEAAKLMLQFQSQHGDNYGGIHVASDRFKFEKTSMSPADLLLDALSRIPETRIAAWFNIPPGVLSYLVGVERNTDNNLERSQEAALERAIMCLWLRYGNQFAKYLLSEPSYGHRRKRGTLPDGTILYAPMTWKVRVGWDKSEVRSLQPDKFKSDENATNIWRWGGSTWNEYRVAVNLAPVEDSDPRGKYVYSDFLAQSAGVAGSGMQSTGGGKNPNPSGGGTANDAQGNKAAGMNDGGNPAAASKVMSLDMLQSLLPVPTTNGSAH